SVQERRHDHVPQHHDVAREPQQDVPEALPVVVAQREGLEMAEQLAAERHDYLLPRARRQHVLRVIELPAQSGEDENGRHRTDQKRDRITVNALQGVAEEMDLPPQKDAVEEELDRPRLEQGHDRVSDRRERGEKKTMHVRLDEGAEPSHGDHESTPVAQRVSNRVQRARRCPAHELSTNAGSGSRSVSSRPTSPSSCAGRRRSRTRCCAFSRRLNRFSIIPLAPDASRAASASSARTRDSASASARGSPGWAMSPVSPSTTASGMPETGVATTGRPTDIASRITVGSPSWSPSEATIEGWASTCARL